MENSIILFLSVFIGSILGYFFKEQKIFSKAILIISAGFLLTICLIEIFPMLFISKIKNIGIWIIAGVFIQLILETITKGVEHGHVHLSEQQKFPYVLLIGLFIHALLEGIPINKTFDGHNHLLTAIFVHNIPISFILSSHLFKSALSPKISILILLLFSLMSPLGSIFGNYISVKLFVIFSAIVGGIFLHISSVIIFESNENHKLNYIKLFYVFLGVLLGFLTIYVAH